MSYEIHNADCYEYIKQIPNKSIDLVYIDIPYLYNQGGCGSGDFAERTAKKRLALMGATEKYMNDFSSKKEALRIAQNLQLTNIENGCDYSIFNILCEKMKHIYIYMV